MQVITMIISPVNSNTDHSYHQKLNLLQTPCLSPARNTQVAPSADDMAGMSDENYAEL